MTTKMTLLYAAWTETDAYEHGELLYVGITGDGLRRLHEHVSDQLWGQDVSGIGLETWPDRVGARIREAQLIRAWRPEHNRKPAADGAIFRRLESYSRKHFRWAESGEPITALELVSGWWTNSDWTSSLDMKPIAHQLGSALACYNPLLNEFLWEADSHEANDGLPDWFWLQPQPKSQISRWGPSGPPLNPRKVV